MAHYCEEVITMIADNYIRCGREAKTQVKHRGREEGPYWMCPEHASHNISNRNAEDVTPEEERIKEYTYVCIGIGSDSGYKIDDQFMPQVYELLSKLERQS